MGTTNRLKSRAENPKTFVGRCLAKTSLTNQGPLFPTDDRDAVLTSSDAGRNGLELPTCRCSYICCHDGKADQRICRLVSVSVIPYFYD